MLYGAYLRYWYNTHDEGKPVCFEEFVDNELQDDEYMTYVIQSAPALVTVYTGYIRFLEVL